MFVPLRKSRAFMGFLPSGLSWSMMRLSVAVPRWSCLSIICRVRAGIF